MDAFNRGLAMNSLLKFLIYSVEVLYLAGTFSAAALPCQRRLSTIITPPFFKRTIDNSNSLEYSFLSASRKMKSYFFSSSGIISNALPAIIFIFSSTPDFLIYPFAKTILSLLFSIVWTIPFFLRFLAILIEEYAIAVPISSTRLGFIILIRISMNAADCQCNIGI